MISSKERQVAIKLIKEAMNTGARQEKACELVGITNRTYQRWQDRCQDRWQDTDLIDQRQVVKKQPANRLNPQEREQIIAICNQEEFQSQSPKQIVPILADKGCYVASESTFYRILREENMIHHRGRTRPAGSVKKPLSFVADGPNQVWSWDITYLATSIKGMFFYLYLFMDVYSRKIVGWEVYETESAEQAADILRKTRLAESISYGQEIALHSDNGGPMKGATMVATMERLGVAPSFSRPSVSNDNPYSESLFKTLKYGPSYPSKPFESVDEARLWVLGFVRWYNQSHRHSGIKYVTPEQRHNRLDQAILAKRKAVYEAAKACHPRRWTKNTRNWNHEPKVYLNPEKEKEGKNAA